jgi:prepilin-type N-terminal cleavage/methylation domain-containing protein
MGARSDDRRRCVTSPAARGDRAGFTLIELLVVVAIIGLLTAILLPSLTKARLLARRTACQANLAAIGKAAVLYQSDYGEYVPICWANISPDCPNPWKSWRATLLRYASGVAAFNCPAAKDTGSIGEVFHSVEEMSRQDMDHTINAGSYGVMYQYALPSYMTLNDSGLVTRGHPMWSCAFSTAPGVSWRKPADSVYVADACLTQGPVTYPSVSHKGYGTSAIVPPSADGYFDLMVTRRFADRHLGTNCLFLGGNVVNYATSILDHMPGGSGNNVWTTE